jgi:hypothetical protein
MMLVAVLCLLKATGGADFSYDLPSMNVLERQVVDGTWALRISTRETLFVR